MARVAVPGPDHDQLQRVRGYLVALLAALWHDGEGFSGRRPFGESGWEWDLCRRSSRPGSSEGTIDDHGFAGGIPPASKNEAPEMIVVITGAPGGH